MSGQGERFDIYNDSKERTGRTMEREGSFLREGEYCLIVLCILRTEDGRYLITKRSPDKRWAPGAWEVPGGGVQAGESSLEAVARETLEETGIDIKGCPVRLIDTYSNVDLQRGDNYFVDIYLATVAFSEKDVDIQQTEATDFRIVPFAELRTLNEEGAFLHFSRIETALKKAGETELG